MTLPAICDERRNTILSSLPAERFTAEQVATLYHERREIELGYRDDKSSIQHNALILRSKTVELEHHSAERGLHPIVHPPQQRADQQQAAGQRHDKGLRQDRSLESVATRCRHCASSSCFRPVCSSCMPYLP
ncbi:hypothetical protein D3C78_1086530 [compost metagenome]